MDPNLTLAVSLKIPEELWLLVLEWLNVPTAIRLVYTHSFFSRIQNNIPWNRLISNDLKMWTPNTRRSNRESILRHKWTYKHTKFIYSSLQYQQDHGDKCTQPIYWQPVVNYVDAYARSVQTIGDIGNLDKAIYSISQRGLLVYEADTSSLNWYNMTHPNTSELTQTSSIKCVFTSTLPWELAGINSSEIETSTVWSELPPAPQYPVQLLSLAGEPEDFIGLTNYRQYFRMTHDPQTHQYHTRELLLNGEFEHSISRPRLAYYVYPYLVIIGNMVTPPVTNIRTTKRVVGVWNISTQRSVFHYSDDNSWFRECVCVTTNETGRILYWIDDKRHIHCCDLDNPYVQIPNYPKSLPTDRLTYVSNIAVSEMKHVVALYSQHIWTLYDLTSWVPLRTYALRNTTFHFCPWADSVLLTRIIGTRLLIQRVRLGSESFFLSSSEANGVFS